MNEGAGGGKALRLLYVNSGLRRADIWTGVRARQLVDELVRQGASVSTFPHNTERHGREEDAAKQMGGLKDFVKDNFPAKLVLLFVEFWLMVSGAVRSLANTAHSLCRRRNLDADVILVRSKEYDWTPWLMSRFFKLPVVQEIHSVFHVERSQCWGKPVGEAGGCLSQLELKQQLCADKSSKRSLSNSRAFQRRPWASSNRRSKFSGSRRPSLSQGSGVGLDVVISFWISRSSRSLPDKPPKPRHPSTAPLP